MKQGVMIPDDWKLPVPYVVATVQAAWGEPVMCSEDVYLKYDGCFRSSWLWFPDGLNCGFHVDNRGPTRHATVKVWGKRPGGVLAMVEGNVSIGQHEDVGDVLAGFVELCWPEVFDDCDNDD